MANTTSKSQTGYYSNYKATSRWKTNRERKLLKALKEQPNNKNIEAALGNINYRRKTPTTPMWSSTNRKTAQILKQFCGSCPHEVFSSNEKVSKDAMAALKHPDTKVVQNVKVDFSLGFRAGTTTQGK